MTQFTEGFLKGVHKSLATQCYGFAEVLDVEETRAPTVTHQGESYTCGNVIRAKVLVNLLTCQKQVYFEKVVGKYEVESMPPTVVCEWLGAFIGAQVKGYIRKKLDGLNITVTHCKSKSMPILSQYERPVKVLKFNYQYSVLVKYLDDEEVGLVRWERVNCSPIRPKA